MHANFCLYNYSCEQHILISIQLTNFIDKYSTHYIKIDAKIGIHKLLNYNKTNLYYKDMSCTPSTRIVHCLETIFSDSLLICNFCKKKKTKKEQLTKRI